MSKTAIKIGPADHGKKMSLEDFDHAEVQEGYLYELSRGVISVSDIPGRRHMVQLTAIRRQFANYDLTHPGRIDSINGGSESKLLLFGLQSERHPDLSIYKFPPVTLENMWETWIPEIVVEIVSPRSARRDYEEKREEYLEFGVREYWIFDANRREMLVHRRSGDRWIEKTVRPPKTHRTRVLPGLEFSCATVFDAADAVGQ